MNADTNVPHQKAEPGKAVAETGTESVSGRTWKKAVFAVAGILIFAVLATGIHWSLQPDSFDVRAVAVERVGDDEAQLRPGVVAVSSVGKVAKTLLDKPGGYLYNDIAPPGVYLDNMPSWEYGVLKEVRDSLGALRNDFSRSQTQSIENLELRKADEYLNYAVYSWMLPSTESEFREGIRALDRYLDALIAGDDPSARFYTRADNLAAYLGVVEKRLGSYAQRLSASVGDPELTAGFVTGQLEEAVPPPGGGAGSGAATPWLEIDNIFYEARGYSWALLHMFKALSIEFEPVLRDKNAEVTVQQIIFDLEQATKRMWSPMVLNGHGFGYVANHSLVLGSYISRANAAVLDLRILLQQG
jgi:hypothetical protein